MSPSRSRQQFVPSRPRSEVIAAVVVAVGIVVATAVVIWLIRPGRPGVPGTGGLLSRQPRMTILVLGTIAALAGVIAFVRGRRQRLRFGVRGSIGIGVAVVIVAAVAGAIFWPGGVIRDYPKQPKVVNTPATLPVTVPTTAKPATTAPTVKTTTTVATTTTKSG